MIEVVETKIAAVKRIIPKCFVDERGFFMETYSQRLLDIQFVQDNLSLSKKAGTLRGLHFQLPPFDQCKLVSVVQGSILDVAVDLRKDSETFGQHITCVLSAENREQLLVPVGFAHGFLTLEPDTKVAYKVTNFYSKEHDRGILWNDPDIGIAWPKELTPPILSEKDTTLPTFKELFL